MRLREWRADRAADLVRVSTAGEIERAGVMTRRAWPITIIWIVGLLLSGAGYPGATELIEFEIRDQFDRIHTDGDLRGQVVLIFGTDRDGSRFGGPNC